MKDGITAITVSHLYKSYGKLRAVNDLNFSVPEGTCFGLLGPNGAGKTTTMKMLYGKAVRDKHKDTHISIFGFDPARQELSIKALSGVVSQDDNLDEELNVYQNLKIFCGFYGISGKIADQRIDQLLEFMELEEKKKAMVDELSGGMKRRLVIARALLNNPRLLFLDEPTTGLDPQVRHVIWDKVRNLKEQGVTVLLTTHYMEEAFQMCDNLLIMDKGKKVIEGAPYQLLHDNIEEYVLEVLKIQGLSCLEQFKDNRDVRMEAHEDMTMFYANDLSLLKKMSDCLNPGEYYLRQSNLEDIFLKTTGRGLNELQ